METLTALLQNEAFVLGCFAVIIFGLTQLIKKPIKHFTAKITDERTRRMVNATILLVPFALGILFQALFAIFYLNQPINIIVGVEYGTAGISVYGVVERFLNIEGKKVVSNPYDTADGKAVQDLVKAITADGKIDAKDKSAVEAFYDKIK